MSLARKDNLDTIKLVLTNTKYIKDPAKCELFRSEESPNKSKGVSSSRLEQDISEQINKMKPKEKKRGIRRTL
jgi:hypothetical protein